VKVLNCSGASGHNVEYVLRLADWFRQKLPEVQDEHLFTLDAMIRTLIRERGLCLKSMMKEECHEEHEPYSDGESDEEERANSENDDDAEEEERQKRGRKSGGYASNVGRKALRCCKV